MPTTKTEQIASLRNELNYTRSEMYSLKMQLEQAESALEVAEAKIAALYAENDKLTHTPEFAADTNAAFNRGRQDGMRVLARRTNSDVLELANEIVAAMNELVNRYTRNLTAEVFLGNVVPAKDDEEVEKLPETDFTKELLKQLSKEIKMGPLKHTYVE